MRTTGGVLPADDTDTMAVCFNNEVWVAYSGRPLGLAKFAGGKWSSVGLAEGLPNLVVNDIQPTTNGCVVSTEGGVAVFTATGVQQFTSGFTNGLRRQPSVG